MNQVDGNDVGFPSVFCEYVLLPLVNKEAVLAYGREEYGKAGNPSIDRRGKKAESESCHVATQEARCEVTNHEPHGKI